MRFDKIDLVGTFKIKGLTGNAGQAIGLSGSEFSWVDAQATTIDALGLTGTNYVICQSGSDSFVNGDLLLSAYLTASNIAITTMQRTTVLVTPGLYNLNSYILLDTTMVDFVGLSSNPSDIILQGIGSHLFRINPAVDTGLANMTLDLSSNSFGIWDVVGGSYLRWSNLIIKNGSIFTDESDSSVGIIGEFDNIEIIDCANAFYVLSGDINGTFENIRIKNTPKFFINDSGNIYGTFSNLELSGPSLSYGFYSNGNFHAYIDNFKALSDIQYDLFGGNGLSGDFRNIQIKNCGYSIFFTNSGNIEAKIENVLVDYCGGFLVSGGGMDGVYNQIEISICTGEVISSNFGNILGDYRDIKIGDISGYFTHTLSGDIQGEFSNIVVGNVAQSCFVANGGSILSTVHNFKSKIVTNSVLFSENNLLGTFSNIDIDKVGEYFVYSYNQSINGTYLNIHVKSSNDSFFATQSLNGEFRNITIGTASGLSFIVNSESFDGVFDSIKIGDVNKSVFGCSYGTMSGTFSNIKVGRIPSQSSGFGCYYDHIASYENIEIGDSQGIFYSALGNLNLKANNISFQDISLSCLTSGNELIGNYKNLFFNKANSFTCLYAGQNINIELDSLKLYGASSLLSTLNGSIIGTFSNISCHGGISTEAFGALNQIQGRFTNIYFPDNVTSFMSVGSFQEPMIIRNLHLKGHMSSTGFQGYILDSYVDSRGFGVPSILLDHTVYPTIERCKFLSDYYVSTINTNDLGSNRCKISFTTTNYGITNSIINEIGDPFNTNNPNLI